MKAVIETGGKQYVVSEGETLEVELLGDAKKVDFEPLLVIDGKEVKVGSPKVAGVKVSAEVLGETRGEKVTSIRFKAKKRVKKVHGHKQHYSQIKILKIA